MYSTHRLFSETSACGQLYQESLLGRDPGGILMQPFYMHLEFAFGWQSRVSLGPYLFRVNLAPIVKVGRR